MSPSSRSSAFAVTKAWSSSGGSSAARRYPPEVMDQIVEKTDGVPLFMEELTKAVRDAGQLFESGQRFELAQPGGLLAIPATLHDR